MKSLPTLTLLLLSLWATAGQAGTPDIGDDINARLARAKSQLAGAAVARGTAATPGVAVLGTGAAGGPGSSTGAGALGNGCNIAIGNIFEDKGRIGTSARRETTVIVTGVVIQVGNNCR